MTRLETDRLVLREVELSDSAALMPVFGDAEVMRFGRGVKTLPQVEAWLLEQRASYRTRGYGKWAVVTRLQPTLLGYCGLSFVGDIAGRPETALGYRLRRDAWGQGYASEAVSATLHHARTALGLDRVVATIDPGNWASIRVAEKAGMVYEREVMFPGYSHPDHLYALEGKGKAES